MDYRDHHYAEAWTRSFKAWEQCCRGWKLYDVAVALEPAFTPIFVEPAPPRQIIDDARTGGGIRGFIEKSVVNQTPLQPQLVTKLVKVGQPSTFYREGSLAEIHIQLPRELDVNPALSEQLLLSIGHFNTPVAFEIFGDRETISLQHACEVSLVQHLTSQWKASVPDVTLVRRDGFLADKFSGLAPTVIVDFGLSNSFLLPLREFRSFNPDPLAGVIGSLASLASDERAALQVMFIPAKSAWGDEALRAVADTEQRKLLNEINPNYSTSIKDKFATPLFAVSIRLMGQASSFDRCWTLLKQIGGSLRQFGHPRSNELIALSCDGYSAANHRLSFFSRTNYRMGMLLNTSELSGLVHLPASSIQTPKLARAATRTKPVPKAASGNTLILGQNRHDGSDTQASLSEDQRTRHVHIIGSTGSGKSTLLLNMAIQDMQAGNGLCLLDPAGDLVNSVCANVPDARMDDVILFDPSDTDFPIGFNVLQAHSDLEKTLIASDLVSAFRRMATSWGDVMDATLANAVLAILESDRGGTLADLKRFLVEKPFREEFLTSVHDDSVRYFWNNEFPLVSGKPQASILIRLDAFLRQRLVRNIVCQKDSKLDFRSIMDNKKILLVKLSQGMMGLENAHLLGTLIVTKLHQIALSRQDTDSRPFFAIYIDEFHNFVGPSIEPILSGIRKYNISLTLSHQEFRQLQSRSQEVAASVVSNCYTRICFRLGDTDADRFAAGFSSFDAADLQNLGIGEAIVRVERADYDFNLQTNEAPKPETVVLERKKTEIIRRSREKFAAAKSLVENLAENAKTYPVSCAVRPENETVSAHRAAPPTVDPKDLSPSENEHLYLQRIMKRIAEKYDFIATVEKSVLGGTGRIDVALDNGTVRVACEIAVTNTVEYEVRNIQKCLSAGYDRIVVLSLREDHLRDIEQAAKTTLANSQLDRLSFLEPQNFHVFLESLSNETSNKPLDAVKVNGYRVKTSYAEISVAEAEVIGQTLLEVLDERDKK